MKYQRVITDLLKGVMAVCLLGMLTWWAMLTWGVEHCWVSALLQYAPYWVVFFPMLLAWGLSWLLPWCWRGVASLAFLVLLWPVMGLELKQGDTGQGHVRLMTYNVKSYFTSQHEVGMERLLREVALYDPDIIVMQDAGELNAINVPTSEAVRKLAGGKQLHAFGQYVVASRFPLCNCEKGWISYDNKPHTYVCCRVTVYGQDIDLYNVHLLTPREGINAIRHHWFNGRGLWVRNYQARLTQANTLAAKVSKRRHPVILAGDLNAPERSMVVQKLVDTGLRDAFSMAGKGYGYTHGHSLRPGLSINRIDHILVSNEIGVARCFVGNKEPSDHRPVIADLLIHRN